MTKIKEVWTILLAVLMAALFMPTAAFAQEVSTPTGTPITGTATITEPGDYYLADSFTGSITVDIEGETDEPVTIDLNGCTLSNDGDAIINKAPSITASAGTYALQITGTGRVQSMNGAAVANVPGAECGLKGGTYYSESWYPIKNLGDMEIYDGVAVRESSENTYPLIGNGWADPDATNPAEDDDDKIGKTTYYWGDSDEAEADITIYGGTFAINKDSDVNQCVLNDNGEEMDIYGGTFDSGSKTYAVKNRNYLIINGGRFIGKTAVYFYYNDSEITSDINDEHLEIHGGKLMSTGSKRIIDYYDGDNAEADMSGYLGIYSGWFNKDISGIISDPEVRATVFDGSTTWYLFFKDNVAEALSGGDLTILQGSFSFPKADANIFNDKGNTGTVTVDGKLVPAGGYVLSETSTSIKTLTEQVNALKAQLSAVSGQSSANSAQAASLQSQLTQVQAALKEAKDVQAQFSAVAAIDGTKAKAGKRKVTLTWTPLTANVTGYQICRKVSGGKYKLVKTVKTAATGKWTNRETYYYKIRAYKNVTGGQMWGAYTKSMKVKVK